MTVRLAAALLLCLAGCPAADQRDPAPDSADGVETTDVGVDSLDAGPPDSGPMGPQPREPGVRAPRTAVCDPADPQRCLLPWPSDSFARLDAGTATGLRLEVDAAEVGDFDDAAALLRADGFSRVNPIITAYAGLLDADSLGDRVDGALRVVVSEPGDRFGEVVPLRFLLVPDAAAPQESALMAFPRRPMAAASEHVVVVVDSLRRADGTPPAADRLARVAVGLEAPADELEAEHHAYHHPSRLALSEAGVPFESVLRLWSFTTRSRLDPLSDLQAVRAGVLDALDAGSVGVAVDEVELAPEPTVAIVVSGRLTSLPDYSLETGRLRRDAADAPLAEGVREAVFRIAVPVGDGDYRVVMFCHGMGGDVSDDSFDDVVTGEGAAKVGIQYDDWTEAGLATKLPYFTAGLSAGDGVAGGFIESTANGIAIQYALGGILGDTLAAAEIGGEVNPAEGRRPDLDAVMWAGGSLGGTAGAVYASAEPTIEAAVLNVPGGAMSHFLRFSMLYDLLEIAVLTNYERRLDVQLLLAMVQTALDPGDGATWTVAPAEPAPIFLIQQSIGDPVLPNIGQDLLAAATKAGQVGAVLNPVVDVEPVDEAVGRTGFTQYRVASDEAYAIHGFAAGSSVAGQAAREQITSFIHSVWAGQPRVEVPPLCLANEPQGSCDFGF